jgi:uncharacterized peroxidase-related enzyme
MSERVMFLAEPPVTDASTTAYDDDRRSDGYVNNLTRLWCWWPDLMSSFMELGGMINNGSTLTQRDRSVIITATAAARRDSYCSLAWGTRLARLSDDQTAAQVIDGLAAPGLSARELALADWARQVARDPNATTVELVEKLRGVGLDDRAIFDATAVVAFRLAFSTINDALGAAPDKQLAEAAPASVRGAVTYGRAVASDPSTA